MKIRVITKRKGTGATTADAIRPAISDDIPGLTLTDFSALPGSKSVATDDLMFVQVEASQAQIDAIKAHADYGVASIIWQEGDSEKVASIIWQEGDSEKPVDITTLSDKLQAMGVKKSDADTVVAGAKDQIEAFDKINLWIQTRTDLGEA